MFAIRGLQHPLKGISLFNTGFIAEPAEGELTTQTQAMADMMCKLQLSSGLENQYFLTHGVSEQMSSRISSLFSTKLTDAFPTGPTKLSG